MAQHAGESKRQPVDRSTKRDEVAASRDDPSSLRDSSVGTLERIWLKRGSGGPMDPVDAAVLDVDRGLLGNANRSRRRQVTIISRERWTELMNALGADLNPSARRANLMISGLDLQGSRGRVLLVGNARLKINGETRPCEQMDEAFPGLQELMRERWGGGVFAEVLEGGEIRIADGVEWEPAGVTLFDQTATIR
jgi:hypothetical protein